MERSTPELHGSGTTISSWMPDLDAPAFPPLAADAECDVCVIGAGIAGLTTAYLLAKAGKRVIVLEDGPAIADGESARTTGHVATANDDYYSDIESKLGADVARTVAESYQAAVDRMEAIVRAEGMDDDTFVRLDGYYFLGKGDTVKTLDDELHASHRAGIADTERVDRIPGAPFDSGPALRFPRQGQVHILKYLAGLARAVVQGGGRIHCSTAATEMTDGAPCRVQVRQGHTVTARDVVIATNTPVNDRFEMHTKQAPYRTYVIAAQYLDWVAPTDVKSADAIAPGEGAVLRRGTKPVAVYKAPDGAVTERSAVCPHLGCVVHWNTLEKSWDCPCHGSRFACDGAVLTGPSRAPLPAVEG